jgi:transcription initiation factor TFIIIB Brf1 subunit/transcription initiation factor TFIIB
VECIPERERGKIKMRIINDCRKLEETVSLMGRTPKAVAGAVMFIVINSLGYTMSRQDICRICDISGPTLSKIETLVKRELQ